MTILESPDVACRTLATRLSEGAIPVREALRYAALLAEALRKMHDAGRSHGAVSPEMILLTAEGLELPPATTRGPADIPGDIFAFGTVLGQMLSAGREDAEEHGVGPLIAACTEKDPGARPPNMQKVLLELRLAGLSARHWGNRTAGRDESDAALRAEIRASEVRQEMRMREHELQLDAVTRQFAELERGVSAAIQQLGARMAEAIRAVEQDIGRQTATLESVRGSMAHTDDLVGRVVETVEARLTAVHRSAGESASRIDALEDAIKAADVENSSLYNQIAAGLRKAQGDIEAQAAAVASVKKSTAQTDDLVGRVVEAVENILELGVARA